MRGSLYTDAIQHGLIYPLSVTLMTFLFTSRRLVCWQMEKCFSQKINKVRLALLTTQLKSATICILLCNISDILWGYVTSRSADECTWSANNTGRCRSSMKISQRVVRTIWQLIKKRRAVNRPHGHWWFCCSADGLWWEGERWLSLSGLPSSAQQECWPIIEISGRGHRVDKCVCVLYVWVHLKRVGGG